MWAYIASWKKLLFTILIGGFRGGQRAVAAVAAELLHAAG